MQPGPAAGKFATRVPSVRAVRQRDQLWTMTRSTLPCLGLSIRHVSRLDRRLGPRRLCRLPLPRGYEEKVMIRIDCCSSGIHAVTPHLDDGDLAGTTCGDQLAP